MYGSSKKIVFLVGILVCSLVFLPTVSSAAGHKEAPDGFFTPEALAEFDGTEDKPAYVAYEGRVYDLTETFDEGVHAGHQAGQNLTEAAKDSPHGPGVLEDKEVVGYKLSKVLTEQDLAEYDGTDGKPAFVAVDKIIYDGSDFFPEGEHYNYLAGRNLTEEFYDYHEEGALEEMPVVGVLVQYELSEEELAKYDGKEGRPAFVAIDEIIYDGGEFFEDGTHARYEAGKDLTEEIEKVGHGRSILPELAVVGVLVEN